MAIFSVFSLAELILCKSCLRFMSNFASAKNRNAAEEKKKEVSNIAVWPWDTDEKYAHN